MAKRVWYLKPGATFKRFWADLNYVERRQYKAQRWIPVRWLRRAIDEWCYLAALESRRSSPVVARAVLHHVATTKDRGLVPMFLTGKE